MIPGPPREADVGKAPLLSRWLATLRTHLVDSLAERPRVRLWTSPAVTGASGTTYLSADAVPWPLGAVVLSTVLPVDSPTAVVTAAPYVLALPLADGRWRLDWAVPGATARSRLVLALVEAV